MKWIEITLETQNEEIEQLCLLLTEIGIEGICIEDTKDFQEFFENNKKYWDIVDTDLEEKYNNISRIKFYVPDDKEGKKLLETARKAIDRQIAIKNVNSEDWENNWREYYQPIEIGKRLLIVPDWLEIENRDRIQLCLEPGLAFGTGGHPTTQMCLEALEEENLKGKKVLDLGCGSGILGIGAKLLGCEEVTACDVDPLSPDVAMENAKRNKIEIEKYHVFSGDIIADEETQLRAGKENDIVVANIFADVIIPLSAFVRQFMKEKGKFICSGIIESRDEEVENNLIKNGWKINQKKKKEEWYCYICS